MASDSHPRGLRWRSNTFFIISTVALGLFTDLFLYGLVVPVLPFMLRDRLAVPEDEIQSHVSGLLTVYAGVQLLSSVPIGWLADRTQSRQSPFLCGLVALTAGTIMLALGQNIAVMVIARALQGVSASVVWTIGLAMVLDTVGTEHLGKTMGTIFSTISVGTLVAPVLGGLLYDKTGFGGVFGLAVGIIVIDFIMRLLMIEKKTAAKYDSTLARGATNPRQHETTNDDGEIDNAHEQDALLPRTRDEAYKIKNKPNKLVRSVPILYCLRNPRLLMAFALSLVQATLLAVFDSTIPTEAQSLFGFNSLKAGLLFIALDIPYLVFGPVAGWAVDKYGTKPAAVIGFAWLVPALVLLRLPTEGLEHGTNNVALYCAMLALNGVGLAVIGSPSFVEASEVVQKYDQANPEFFGANGPYAQLYGFSSMFFCAGLTVGPVLSGALKDSIGYGNMNIVFAAVAAVTSVLSFLIIGGKPKVWRRR
ncbi:major facilitator superfamily domain-containing protein [Truncatella angustata]|uniref:Major facilitator superfamily domain-containing protein n=1 Tax=Truncatella angustata TaxID=152316 RepID=A0A9P8RE83_9PEZI|nr:major facilitator superfamily domain-containing protein [Truncatella angustata]KAH6638645.1 major facilitator superfamily domain-containing protein [Truncatella angustata]